MVAARVESGRATREAQLGTFTRAAIRTRTRAARAGAEKQWSRRFSRFADATHGATHTRGRRAQAAHFGQLRFLERGLAFGGEFAGRGEIERARQLVGLVRLQHVQALALRPAARAALEAELAVDEAVFPELLQAPHAHQPRRHAAHYTKRLVLIEETDKLIELINQLASNLDV